MPIHKVEGGFQWGGRGKVYSTREGAARQARAAYANGYVGKSLVEIRKSLISAGRNAPEWKPITAGGQKVSGRLTRLRQRMEYSRKVLPPRVLASSNSRAEYEALQAKVKGERGGMRSHEASVRRAQQWRKRLGKPEPTRQQAAAMRPGHSVRAGVTTPVGNVTRSPYVTKQPKRPAQAPRNEVVESEWRARRHNTPEAQAARAKKKKQQAKESAKLREKNYARNMDEAYNNVHFTTNQKRTVAAGTTAMLAGTGGTLYANRDKKVEKADTDEKKRIARDAAMGVAAGTGAAYAIDHAGGYAAKKILARRRRDALINDPKYRPHYEKHWNKFKQEKGFDTIAGKTGFENSKIMRDYPKKLKDWKGQRALAWQSSKRGQALTFGGAALGGAALAARHGYKKRQQQESGPVMKDESAGHGVMMVDIHKDRGGTNIREYANLPENIRSDVGYGSIHVRRNPMSPLDLFASARIMTESRARAENEKISRRRLTRRAHNEMSFAGSRAMLYSPTGRGSVF